MLRNCTLYVKSIALIIGFLWALPVRSQNLSGCIQGVDRSKGVLGYYLGSQKLLEDSIVFDKKGCFQNKGILKPGFYFISIDSARTLDFFVGEEDIHLSLQSDPWPSVTWKDDANKSFVEFQQIGANINQQFQSGSITAEDAQNLYDQQIVYWHATHENARISKLLQASNPLLQVTEIPKGGIEFWVKQYWGKVPLSDPALLRSPFLQSSLQTFFEKAFYPDADSINVAIDILWNREMDSLVENFCIAWLANHFENSKIMGHDAVFVHIVNKFYKKGRVKWETPETLKKIVAKSDELQWNLIGSVAPNFEFIQSTGQLKHLNDYKGKWTILYFYDATCQHCLEVTPMIFSLFSEFKSKLNVIAISTETTMEEWQSYITKNQYDWVNGYDNRMGQINFRHYYYIPTTPTLLVLDPQLSIAAKGLTPADLREFLLKNLDK